MEAEHLRGGEQGLEAKQLGAIADVPPRRARRARRARRLRRARASHRACRRRRVRSLELIDIPAEAAAHEPWFNETLSTVNDAVVRLGVIEGDFHGHKHEGQDEFFLVLAGKLLIDLEDRETVALGPHHGYTVPRGAVHRTRAPERTEILMVEAAGVAPTGD